MAGDGNEVEMEDVPGKAPGWRCRWQKSLPTMQRDACSRYAAPA
jgi:hypothetical protein